MKEITNDSNESKSGNMYSYQDNNKNQIPPSGALQRGMQGINPNNKIKDPPNYNPKIKNDDISSNTDRNTSDDTVIIHLDLNPPLYWMVFILFGSIQVIIILLIGFYYNWDDYYTNPKSFNNNSNNRLDETLYSDEIRNITGYDVYKTIKNKYKSFQEVNIMIFLGFGLLRSFLKHHSWTSIILTLIGGMLSIELALFTLICWSSMFYMDWSYGKFNFQHLLDANFCGGSVIISLGAVLGKLSIPQYIVLILFETIFSSLNYTLLRKVLKIIDVGGTMTMHLFGAVFGGIFSLISFVPKNERQRIRESRHLGINYKSINYALIGNLILISFWPSLNTCLINDDDYDMKKPKYTGIINTYFAIIGSIISTFCTSPIFNRGKFNIDDILNSCFAGGIAIGGCCHLIEHYWLSLIIGFLVGGITSCLYNLLAERLQFYGYHDTAKIFYYHGIPGFCGGIITTIFVGNLVNVSYVPDKQQSTIYKFIGTFLNYYNYKRLEEYNDDVYIPGYAAVHFAAIWITIGIAAACGFMAGFSIKFCNCRILLRYFNDYEFFDERESEPFPWQNEKVKVVPVYNQEE